MASTYSNLKIELITTGEQTNTWGITTNTNLGTAIEEAIVGYATANFLIDSDLTLNLTNTNASQIARNLVLNVTSSVSLCATRNLIVPSIQKPYYIFNNTSGGQSIVVKTLAGTGITVPNGSKMFVYVDETNVVEAINRIGSLTLGSPINVSSGGTGAVNLSGVLKGNGGSAISAATAGTDFVAPGTATSFTALQAFNGSVSNLAASFNSSLEKMTISATAATGTVQFDALTQPILYYTSNASGNWTLNIRGSSTVTLNSLMSIGQSITVIFMVTNGATAYYQSALTIDGASVVPKWQGGVAPTVGNINAIDIYSITVIKTGSGTFTALANQNLFQ